MTRHDKQETRAGLCERAAAAVLSTGYWPADCEMHVQFGEPHASLNRKMCRRHRARHIFLSLPHTWLEDVFERGIAVAGGCFVLSAKAAPDEVPSDQEAWDVDYLRLVGFRTWQKGGVLLRYGGDLYLGETMTGLQSRVASAMRRLWTGEDDMPF